MPDFKIRPTFGFSKDFAGFLGAGTRDYTVTGGAEVCEGNCNNESAQKPKKKAEDGSRTHNLRFTKPLLCQLSYLGTTLL